MADTGKKIEVRYGAFACRVEGYDDPVGKLREVLSVLQRVIEETPAMAEHELDRDQLGRLDAALQDRRIETDGTASGAAPASTPGLVVIRSGDGWTDDVAGSGAAAATDADRDDDPGLPPPADRPAAPDTERSVDGAEPAADPQEDREADAAPDIAAAGGQAPSASPAGLFAAPAASLADETFSEGIGAPAGAPRPDTPAPDAPARPGPGAPGEPWTPWGSWPGSSPLPDAASASTDTGTDTDTETAEPLPAINIFAPPPPHAPATLSAMLAQPRAQSAALRPEPLAPLRRMLRPEAGRTTGGDDRNGAAKSPGDERNHGTVRADDPDEPREGGAEGPGSGDLRDADGEWDRPEDTRDDGRGFDTDPGADDPEGGAGGGDNRLAALISRYQSSLQEPPEDEREPAHTPESTISAAELAERAEAREVSDLLAVSAAWLALVGGRDHFTRREVMEVFETLPGNHPRTLEARIKGFGNLVRTGILELVDDGAFALARRERAHFAAMIDQG